MPKLSDLVPIASIPNLNVGLSSAREETMIACLGSPQMPLTTDDTPERASPTVKKLEKFQAIGGVNADGIAPAVDSLQTILTEAFGEIPELEEALRGDGMLVVRLRRPTSHRPSTKISNHAWGTAIDLKLDGMEPPGATGDKVPYFIAALAPYFNKAGWYSGIGFADDMHFEVADETIRTWAADGEFRTPPSSLGILANATLGRAGIPDHLLVLSGHDHEVAEAAKYKPTVDAAASNFQLDPLLIYGLGSRESDWGLTLKPPGPAGTGDWAPRDPAKWGFAMPPDGLGWGRGLLQVDYQQAFAQTGDWRDPAANINYGCHELAGNITYFTKLAPAGVDPQRAGIAAYNCGRAGVMRAVNAGYDVDQFTTGKNYSTDVLHRMAWFQSLVG
jgi:hypothetical protein